MEIWKDIEGYEGLYQISSLGNVKSLSRMLKHNKGGVKVKRETILKHQLTSGYPSVCLYNGNRVKQAHIHRLLAIAFIPNPDNKPEVNHINGIKKDFRIENLEWCTVSENIKHAWNTGLSKAWNKGSGKRSSEEIRIKVKELRSKGITQYRIAEIVSINQSEVSRILNNKII